MRSLVVLSSKIRDHFFSLNTVLLVDYLSFVCVFFFTLQDTLQSDTPLVFDVPVGQIEHSWPIIALTVLSTMAGCSLILRNSLAIT